MKKDIDKKKQNHKVKQMLLSIANMKLNQEMESDEECIICFDNYKPNQEIIKLPCHDKHYFHAN